MDGCDDGAELRLEDAIAFRKRRIGREQVGKQEGRKGWWNGASECCRFRTLRRKRSFLRRKRRRVHGGHELFEGRLTGNEGLDILGSIDLFLSGIFDLSAEDQKIKAGV